MFMPNPQSGAAGAGVTLIVAGLATAVQANLPGGGNALRIVNRGAGDAFIVFQSNAALGSPVATVPSASAAGGFPVLANAPAETVQLPAGTQALSVICSANATLYFTRGQD